MSFNTKNGFLRCRFADAIKANTVDDVEIMKQIGAFLMKEEEEGVSGAL